MPELSLGAGTIREAGGRRSERCKSEYCGKVVRVPGQSQDEVPRVPYAESADPCAAPGVDRPFYSGPRAWGEELNKSLAKAWTTLVAKYDGRFEAKSIERARLI